MIQKKTYKVEVTRSDNSKDTFTMEGTSRRDIFRQLNERIRLGDSFRNPIVTEVPVHKQTFLFAYCII